LDFSYNHFAKFQNSSFQVEYSKFKKSKLF
jgi:hypothetical protein